MTKKPDQPAVETDPRFPSGSWIGFWIQRRWGKQHTSVAFRFCEGRISGAGRDIVGKFSFAGKYDLKTGRCEMIKQYLHAHSVQYEGVSEGRELWLWGLWNVRGDKGGFHLWPEGEPDPTQLRTAEEIELPNQVRRRRARVPADMLPF